MTEITTEEVEARADLMEAYAVLYQNAGQKARSDIFQTTSTTLRALDAERRELWTQLAKAKNKALNLAADAIDAHGEKLVREWRAGSKVSTHLEGRADASDEYAGIVRSLMTPEAK